MAQRVQNLTVTILRDQFLVLDNCKIGMMVLGTLLHIYQVTSII